MALGHTDGENEMHIDQNTNRRDLEWAAIFECEFDLAVIEAATDNELREMIQQWILDGDECASA